MRERIKTPLAEEVVEYVVKPRSLPFLARDLANLMWINKAHALMLADTRILPADVVKSLMAALDDMEREGADSLSFDPGLEDIYLNMEHELIQRVGGRRLAAASTPDGAVTTSTPP